MFALPSKTTDKTMQKQGFILVAIIFNSTQMIKLCSDGDFSCWEIFPLFSYDQTHNAAAELNSVFEYKDIII